MKLLRMSVILLIIGQLSLATYGCGGSKKISGDDKVVARINNYTMTVGDFRDSARTLGGTREEVLEEIITRNILIQEAQKENFDKDKAFMKEIEKYWEQALLKILIKKKTAEFSETFKSDKAKVEEALSRWVKNLRYRANVKIYKENLDQINLP